MMVLEQFRRSAAFRRDYYGGLLMLLTGVGAMVQGWNYKVGSLTHMGAGYFPTAVGAILAVLGVLIAVNARGDDSPSGLAARAPEWRGWAAIVGGMIAFLLLGHFGGLLPATFAMVFIAALGDRDNTVKSAALLAAAMTAVAAIVFWWLLRLQFPLVRWG